MTHLFAADEADGVVTEEQLMRLESALWASEGGGAAAGVVQRWQLRGLAGWAAQRRLAR